MSKDPWQGKIVTETVWRIACYECAFETQVLGHGVRSQKTAEPVAEAGGWRKVRRRGWTCPDCVKKSGRRG